MAGDEVFSKADPLQVLGLSVVGIVIPILFPALKPQVAALLKAGAKLVLEAEVDADDALADQLVETTVDALLQVTSEQPDKDVSHGSEAAMKRFLAAAHAGASRRGWDQQDVSHRYRKRLVKLDHAISRAHRRARPSQRKALENASELLNGHRLAHDHLSVNEPRQVNKLPANRTGPAKLGHADGRIRSGGTRTGA
jgi:hypothetical protein